MKNQTYRMTMLFDFYGEILTDRQKEFRQGVRDVIVRAEAAMTELEDKTGLIRRFMQMQKKVQGIEDAAKEIRTINYRQYENPELERLTAQICEYAAALRE